MTITSIPWEKSRYLANTHVARVEGIAVALYHNPGLRPLLWDVYVPGQTAWTFRSRSLAESGAIRRVNLLLSQREKERQMQLSLSDPKTPTQLPPGVADDVGKHDESAFNDGDEELETEEDDEDSALRDDGDDD